MEKDEARKELLNIEILTTTEAKAYIKKYLKIGDTYYNDCVMPVLRPKFKPLLRDFRRNKPAHLVINKQDLDEFIIEIKERLLR